MQSARVVIMERVAIFAKAVKEDLIESVVFKQQQEERQELPQSWVGRVRMKL